MGLFKEKQLEDQRDTRAVAEPNPLHLCLDLPANTVKTRGLFGVGSVTRKHVID